MKRKLMFSLAASTALAFSISHAAINVQWSAADGFLLQDDATGLLENIPSAWVQLVYTPVNSAMLATPGGGVQGGEIVVDEFSIVAGDIYGVFVRNTVAPFVAGFWYARVFEGGSNPSANIVADMWYYESRIIATIDNLTPDSPDVYSINGNNTSPTFGFGDVVNRQVVPEPSTLAFLGIGGLALALRRRFVA